MTIDDLDPLLGTWELTVDLPGAEDVRGQVSLTRLGELVEGHSSVPGSDVPDSLHVIAAQDGGFLQHYFDERGVVRLYAMTFVDRTWTLLRTAPDFSPLAFHQRFVGHLSADSGTITGEWQQSDDGQSWTKDFAMTYRRTR